MTNKIDTIVLGGGCFWCTEAIFKNLRGVINVTPGYAGGDMTEPDYEQVKTGTTGHAEVIKIEYDQSIISLKDLLEVFFAIHDPTTPNRQGNDFGPQYRSIILFNSLEQKKIIDTFMEKLRTEKFFSKPIVTEIKSLVNFYQAENYHLDYYQKNKFKPYCLFVINPKLKKFTKKFNKLIK